MLNFYLVDVLRSTWILYSCGFFFCCLRYFLIDEFEDVSISLRRDLPPRGQSLARWASKYHRMVVYDLRSAPHMWLQFYRSFLLISLDGLIVYIRIDFSILPYCWWLRLTGDATFSHIQLWMTSFLISSKTRTTDAWFTFFLFLDWFRKPVVHIFDVFLEFNSLWKLLLQVIFVGNVCLNMLSRVRHENSD